MARTNPGAVQEILFKDYDSVNEPPLQGYIATASAVVDRVVTCATAKAVTLSAVELELIERWLSAHFYCMSDAPYASHSHLGRSASFQGQTGMYLEATKYGQTAAALDPSGCLVAISKNQRASFSWLGKRPSEQTDYADRD